MTHEEYLAYMKRYYHEHKDYYRWYRREHRDHINAQKRKAYQRRKTQHEQ